MSSAGCDCGGIEFIPPANGGGSTFQAVNNTKLGEGNCAVTVISAGGPVVIDCLATYQAPAVGAGLSASILIDGVEVTIHTGSDGGGNHTMFGVPSTAQVYYGAMSYIGILTAGSHTITFHTQSEIAVCTNVNMQIGVLYQ